MIKVQSTDGQVTGSRGGHVELKCDTYARPYPSITWYRDGVQPLSNNTDPRYTLRGGNEVGGVVCMCFVHVLCSC